MFYMITFSPAGGTKRCANYLASAWTERKKQIDLINRVDHFDEYEFTEDDICLVAVPVFSGRVPSVAAERIKMLRGNGAKAIAVAVYGNQLYGDTLLELSEILRNDGFRVMAAAATIAQHSVAGEFAPGRPDADDIKQLKEWSVQIKNKLESHEDAEAFPPSRPYREAHDTPVTPRTDRSLCAYCGVCVSRCPTEAILRENPDQTDVDKCIFCMGCVSICPREARTVEPEILAKAKLALQDECAERKENELFL
jgi:ferredoxin